MQYNSIRLSLTLCLLATAIGCGETNFNLATKRQDYYLMTTDKEIKLGRKIAKKVEKEMYRRDHPDGKYVLMVYGGMDRGEFVKVKFLADKTKIGYFKSFF